MIIDAHILTDYIEGKDLSRYQDDWIYNCFGSQSVFEVPDLKNREWVAKLYVKIRNQIENFTPSNQKIVRRIFTQFDRIAGNYTLIMAVGFPAPYDAMVMEHNGKAYMVFDLIQFREDSLREDYSCHGILTHELIHLCLREDYPEAKEMSYIEDLNYTAFNEGFAHALSYRENIDDLVFDGNLEEKFNTAKQTLRAALEETDEQKQKMYSRMADTGNYWDKFASIAGMLYLLRHVDDMERIYQEGWHNFAARILEE